MRFSDAVGFPVLCVLFLADAPLARSETAEEVADALRAGNRSALKSIRTLHLKMRMETSMGKATSSTEVECWRRGEEVRQKESAKREATDRWRLGGKHASVSTRTEANGSKRAGAVIQPAATEPGPRDVWEAALCIMPCPQLSLEALLAGEHTLKHAFYEGSGTARVGRLEIELPKGIRLLITVDPSVNHMVRKVEYSQTLGSGKTRYVLECVREATEFAEAAPGIFFPMKVVTRHQYNGKESARSTAAFSEVAVNVPVPPGVFAIRFPAGTRVTDMIAGNTYTVDGAGHPTAAPVKLGVAPNVAATDPTEAIPPTMEPLPWSWQWPTALACGILAAGGAAWSWFRWRRSLSDG